MSGPANLEQGAKWNAASGCVWVEMHEVIDRALAPLETFLLKEAFPGEGGCVLDIGCGAGATTISMARRLGAAGRCVGVDISEPLLAVAKARALDERVHNAQFVQADAQTHRFESAFDGVMSRFGVMFFEDPGAAFANIRSAARPGAGLVFIAWRSPAENPFMTAAARAAGPLLPNLQIAEPDAPGQFGFADGARVRRILQESGWRDIDIRPLDVPATLVEQDLWPYVTKLGPVGVALREPQVDEATRARVAEVLRVAFEPFVEQGAARFNMACWHVSARA